METITLAPKIQGISSRYSALAIELAGVLVGSGVPFHYYITHDGRPRFRFTFTHDFDMARRYLESRGVLSQAEFGKEEP